MKKVDREDEDPPQDRIVPFLLTLLKRHWLVEWGCKLVGCVGKHKMSQQLGEPPALTEVFNSSPVKGSPDVASGNLINYFLQPDT